MEYIYSQIGPMPDDDIVISNPIEYPKDTYEELNPTIDIPWGIIIAIFVLAGFAVLAFFKIKNRLLRKDRDEKASEWTLYEVRVPRGNETEIGVAEKMFANLVGIGGKGKGVAEKFTVNNSISFEIMALPGEIKFYVYSPRKLSDLVEKQILGSYQDADVKKVDDYNIFNKDSKVAFTKLKLNEEDYAPIKVAEDFTGDPLANVLSTLSKMSEGEGAMLQVVISPTDNKWQKNGNSFVKKVENNNSDPEKKKMNVSQEKIQSISKKISKNGFRVDIRIVTTAKDTALAKMHLDNIVGAFDQFSNPGINRFKKVDIKGKRAERDFMLDVVYRKNFY
jgi:hypothetical protein